jgi:hypothetical protein
MGASAGQGGHTQVRMGRSWVCIWQPKQLGRLSARGATTHTTSRPTPGGDGGQRQPPPHQRVGNELETNQQVHPNPNPIKLRERFHLGKDKEVVNKKREED